MIFFEFFETPLFSNDSIIDIILDSDSTISAKPYFFWAFLKKMELET